MSAGPPELPFDLRALEIFLAVCDSGRMSAAARTLGITQPAVSQAIAELERRTGSVLFDRKVRPAALTAAGALLRQRAAALVADAREIPALLCETVHGKVAHLRIGLVDSLSRALTRPIARFLVERAQSASVLSGLTSQHASALLTRRLDMFIGVDDMTETPGLERFELRREPYVLLLPAKGDGVRTLADIERLSLRLPFIRFSARSQTGLEIERHLRRVGLALPMGLEFDTPYAVGAVVAAGGGFAITTPLCVSEAALPSDAVKIVPLPGPEFSRTLTLVARHRELGAIPRDLAHIVRTCLT